MTNPRTLAAILVLSALATPALAQGTSGSDDSPQPTASQPSTANQPSTAGQGSGSPGAGSPGVGSQTGPSIPQPSAGGGLNSTAGTSPRRAGLQNPTLEVQERLQQLGLYSGDIDGKWGPQTRGAVVEFQRSHRLQPTGTLDVATVARLNQMTQNPQSVQGNGTEQESTAGTPPGTPPGLGAGGGNTAEAAPPVPRRPGASTRPGSSTSPGSSTAARATITTPGLGYGDTTFGSSTPPDTGVGNNPPTNFFGSTVDLSNGYNAAVNPNRR